MKGHLETLLRWWAGEGVDPDADRISPSFEYNERGMRYDREEFLAAREGAGPWVNIRIIGVSAEGEAREQVVAMMFESMDSVTGLSHRDAWFAFYRAGVLERIEATGGRVSEPNADENELDRG